MLVLVYYTFHFLRYPCHYISHSHQRYRPVTYTPGRAMAQAVSRRPLTAEARVRARGSKRGISRGKVVLGQGVFQDFAFSLSVSFYRGSPCSYIIWEMNNRPVGGSSSETYSHPIDMIIMIYCYFGGHCQLS
jgi:hypothetical protein